VRSNIRSIFSRISICTIARRTDAGKDALINLSGLRLDGAAAEEYNCQMLISGNRIVSRLKKLNAFSISNHCKAQFFTESKPLITDVEYDKVCRTESEILSNRDVYLKAIESKQKCEE